MIVFVIQNRFFLLLLNDKISSLFLSDVSILLQNFALTVVITSPSVCPFLASYVQPETLSLRLCIVHAPFGLHITRSPAQDQRSIHYSALANLSIPPATYANL